MNKKKVLVLGLDLAGIFAVRAAQEMDCDVTAYSYGYALKNTNFWVQWVPDDISEIVPAVPILLKPMGSDAAYVSLRYGRVPRITFVSDFPSEEKIVHGYNPEEVYEAMYPKNTKLYAKFPNREDVYKLTEKYDFVFQTFASEESRKLQKMLVPYWIGTIYDVVDLDRNEVLYNGTHSGYAVKHSYLWGNEYFEFPQFLPFSEIKRVVSPQLIEQMEFTELQELSPFTDPYQPPVYEPSNLYYVGKWAEWNPARLDHQVYDLVKDILDYHEK